MWFAPTSAKRFRPSTSRPGAKTYGRVNRYYPKGASRRGTLQQQVRSLQNAVNRMKPEKKYVDVALTLTNVVDANGGVIHLTQIAQGDTQSTRTGNAVNVTDVKIGLNIDRGASLGAANGHVRIAVVVDKEQVADTSPVGSAIFTSADPICPRPNLDNLERFRILYISPNLDAQMAKLGTETLVPTRSNLVEYQWSGNLKVSYNGAATTDIEKNGIYLVVLSVFNSDAIDTSGTARIGYTDA